MSVYVEILIRAPLERLWQHTQEPDLHEQWDLRFSEIHYLPRRDGEALRFRYATRLGFGRTIEGDGESVGERDGPDGSRASALWFGSNDPLSLIREGRGYWKYAPATDGVRFLTSYDYSTRFGGLGKAFDRAVFRPLIGWATAWSFDRLRLWLERGLPPSEAARAALQHGIARAALALILAWHGLVPKLLGPDADEVALVAAGGIPAAVVPQVLVAIGVGELLLAAALVLGWHRAWPVVVCLGLAAASTIGVALVATDYLTRAFNPLTLNLAVVALAALDLATLDRVPDAGRCRRRP